MVEWIKKSPIQGLGGSAVIIFLISFFGWNFCKSQYEQFVASPYNEKIDNYTNYNNLLDEDSISRYELRTKLHELGVNKFIVIDLDSKKVDDVFFLLNDIQKPINNNDVNYSLLINRSKVAVGQYGNYGSEYAYCIMAHVKVVNVKEQRLIASYLVFGANPPKLVKKGESRSGKDPITEIFENL